MSAVRRKRRWGGPLMHGLRCVQPKNSTVTWATAARVRFFLCLLALAMAMMLHHGCFLAGLRQDLAVLEQAAEISGRVVLPRSTAHPVFVVVSRVEEDKPVIQAYWVAYATGAFRFPIPAGSYLTKAS